MQVLNEFAQWALLVFLGVVTLGLTRQLGVILTPRRQGLADEFGPDVGARVPPVLMSADEWREFESQIARSPDRAGAIVVVDQDCDACEGWISALDAAALPGALPVCAITRKSDDRHLATLGAVSNLVVVDHEGERLNQAELRGSPFLLVVDEDLKVRFKQLSGDLHEGVQQWRIKSGRADASPASGANGQMTVIEVGERNDRADTYAP